MLKGPTRRVIGPKVGGRSTVLAGNPPPGSGGGSGNANAQLVFNAPAKSGFLALIRLL
jgi:hypothetical protein